MIEKGVVVDHEVKRKRDQEEDRSEEEVPGGDLHGVPGPDQDEDNGEAGGEDPAQTLALHHRAHEPGGEPRHDGGVGALEHGVIDVEEEGECERETVEPQLPGVRAEPREDGRGCEQEDVEAERGQDPGAGGDPVTYEVTAVTACMTA